MNGVSLLGPVKIPPLLKAARAIRCPGAVAEFGVYRGGVLRELAEVFPDREVYGYDTFTGLPASDWQPGELPPGEFTADFDAVRQSLADLPSVHLVRGHLPECAVDTSYAFVHLDLDYYVGTLACLRWLEPRMAEGGAIVLDDYGWPACPGVAKAAADSGLRCERLAECQGIIRF